MRPRVLFFGNPGYGGLLLEELLRHDVEVVGIFQRTTRLWSRWKKTYRRYFTTRRKLEQAVFRIREKADALLGEQVPRPHFGKDVTSIATEHGIRRFDGSLVTNRSCQQLLRSLGVDVILVATFSEFLPLEMLRLPRLTAINMHPSLLPTYRGGFPEFCAIYNGERTTGVTFHLMEERFDSGNIILQRQIGILAHETTLALKTRLAKLACEALPDLLGLIARNELAGQPQEVSRVSYCRLKPNFARIETGMTVRQVQNIINACHDVEDVGTPYLRLGSENVQILSYGTTGIPFNVTDGTIWLDLVRYKHHIYRGDRLQFLARRLGVEYRQ